MKQILNIIYIVLAAANPTQQTGTPSNQVISVSSIATMFISAAISAAVSFFVALFTTSVKIKKEKRVNAKLRIHPSFNDALKRLKEVNDSCGDNGNPYCLLYEEDVIRGEADYHLPADGYEGCKEKYRPIMKDIQILIDDNDNIYPRGVTKAVWGRDIATIRSFGRMILQSEGQRTLKEPSDIHRIKLDELSKSIDRLIDATEYSV